MNDVTIEREIVQFCWTTYFMFCNILSWCGVLALLVSCAGEEQTVRKEVLIRSSLDLRGYRPSLAEMAQGSKNEKQMRKMVESFASAPEFGERYAYMLNGFWKTEVVELDHTDHEYSMENHLELITSMGEEPLHIIQEIADHDLPYSEIVTADWTVNDEVLAEWAPVDYPVGETGWKKVHYTDGRPKAGILVTNGLWWRFNSTQNNAHRGRANIITKNLLCDDFLDKQVVIDRNLNLLDEQAVLDAIHHSPTCYGCHAALDPIAANFWGFYRHFRFSPDEQFSYHPERERDWQTYTGTGPGYYGSPVENMEDFARQISQDPRLYDCVVTRTMEQMYHRPVSVEDWEQKQEHLDKFVQSGYALRALALSVALDPVYQDSDTVKMVTIEMYASQVEHITQFRYQVDAIDSIHTDLFGLRSMGGGSGEDYHHDAFVTPSPTFSLVVQRISEGAAYYVTHDEAAANFFFDFDFQQDQTADPEHLSHIYEKVMASPIPEEELATLTALWTDAYDQNTSGSPSIGAWQMTLTYLFRHPLFLVY
jgi:hypothetical protein